MAKVRTRSVQIKITLTPELHSKLIEVAQEIGQAPATLCSVWIGQAVAQQVRGLAVVEKVGQEVVSAIGSEAAKQMRLIAGGGAA